MRNLSTALKMKILEQVRLAEAAKQDDVVEDKETKKEEVLRKLKTLANF